jgi:tetratricopeptide (TPR) repeat protein
MSEPFGFLPIIIIWFVVRALMQRRGDSPDVPPDVHARTERRANDIDDLLESGALDNAVARGLAWIGEIDTYREPCESVAAGCLASILEAQVRRLPDRSEIASNFGEALLSTLNARPSGGDTAKLRTLCALAVIAEAAGDDAAARARFEASVELAESMDNVAPVDRAYFLYRHAASSRACGDLDEAIRQLERALVLLDDRPEHGEQRLKVLILTGIVRLEKQQIQDSRAALERALALAGASPELEERFWVGAGMFWGQVLLAQNDAGAAEALARTAEVEERVLGPTSPAPISTLYHLAEAYLARGSLPDAVAALERARAIHDRTIGRHSAGLREIVVTLSRVKFEQGEREEARRLLTELVEAEEQVDPPDASVVAATNVNLAAICRAMGDNRGERERLERALATAERATGVESDTLIPILERLGLAVWNSSDWADAREINRRLAAIQREHLGSDHPALASTLLNQAVVTARCGDHEAVQRLLTETLSILEATPFRPPESVENLVLQLEALKRHPIHGGGYGSLLSRARVLRSEGTGGLPVAQA